MTKAVTVFPARIGKALSAAGLMLALLAGSAGAADAPLPPATIQLGAVALPIVANGRLINYVFVSIKLVLAAGVDGAAVRAKEPYFRDALVRAAHRAPFCLSTDYTHVDVPRVRAEVMSDAVAIVGRGVVTSVVITKQVSQHIIPPPAAAASHAEPELIP